VEVGSTMSNVPRFDNISETTSSIPNCYNST